VRTPEQILRAARTIAVDLGEPCYPSLADLPEPVDLLDVFRRSVAAVVHRRL